MVMLSSFNIYVKCGKSLFVMFFFVVERVPLTSVSFLFFCCCLCVHIVDYFLG